MRKAPGLALALLVTAALIAAGSLAVLLIPQWQRQRPALAGVVNLHVHADGTLRLWNTPVAADRMPSLLQQVRQRFPEARVRLVPDPQVSWGEVQRLLIRLDPIDSDVELELPATTRP